MKMDSWFIAPVELHPTSVKGLGNRIIYGRVVHGT